MKDTRVNEIDLLRFGAALAVVLFHYGFRGYAADGMSQMPYPLLAPVARYGYLGVDLFFMISGFVIIMSAANGNLREFIAARVARLYPAFWACCTITFLVTLAIGAPYYKVSIGQYLINLSMLNEFIDVPSVDGAYWSLAVEIKFYVLVSLALLFGWMGQRERLLLIWLLLCVLAQVYPAEFLTKLFITDYGSYFIAGAVFYLVRSEGSSARRWAMLAACLVLSVHQSLGRAAWVDGHYGVVSNRYVLLAIIGTFFLAMSLISLRKTGLFGQRRWLMAGALTYPLYLLHQNIGFMLFNAGYPEISSHVLLWGVFSGMLLAAFLVHIAVEKPLAPLLKRWIARALDRAIVGPTRPPARAPAASELE